MRQDKYQKLSLENMKLISVKPFPELFDVQISKQFLLWEVSLI